MCAMLCHPAGKACGDADCAKAFGFNECAPGKKG